MWLHIVDKARLINLDHVKSIVLERAPGDHQRTLTAMSHSGAVQPIISHGDSGEANRALEGVRHALQTIALSSDGARSSE